MTPSPLSPCLSPACAGERGPESRVEALRAGLEERGCDALLVVARSSQDPDLAPFVGNVHLGESQLIVPRQGEACLAYQTAMERDEAAATGLRLITPEHLDLARWVHLPAEPGDVMAWVAERSLEAAGVAPGRVALAGHGQAGSIQAATAALARRGWTWVPGNPIVAAVRKKKTAAEVAAIRVAAEGLMGAMRRVASCLAAAVARDGELWLEGERLAVARLRAEIAQALAAQGLEQPKGNIVAPAEEGGVPHSAGTQERVLRAGESIVVDIYPRGSMFSDCTRVFCVPHPDQPPSEALRRAHGLVLQALRRSHERARPGVRGWDLQEEVCALFEAEGFPTPITDPNTTRGYVHNLGHGVGFDLHEQPFFRKVSGAEGVLREGDVFTLEPGLYEPAEGYGVRLEDLVHLGPEGLENLTPLPYDLDPRAW